MKKFLLLIGLLTLAAGAQSQTLITSWMRNTNGMKATYYQSSGGMNPTYTFKNTTDSANVLAVAYSSTYVYIRCLGMADTMGKYLNPGDCVAQKYVNRFPRTPTVPVNKTISPKVGSIGMLLNGVPIYGLSNASSWSGTANANPPQGKGVWNVEVGRSEGFVLDAPYGAHPQQQGAYHSHIKPYKLYKNTPPTTHSALIGYAYDGYPVYGPYGYSSPMDASSIVTRMKTGYSLRNITTRTTLPGGAAASQAGPAVNATYPLGIYCEDYEWLASNGGDLDEYNGRFCVTPEYPNGTYAYFATIDAAGNAAFPYYIGIYYYGQPDVANFPAGGSTTTTITIPAGTTYYTGQSLCVTNNSIDATAVGICPGTIVDIIGSQPAGATGTYAFQWQKSEISATKGFSNIAGANNMDYLVTSISKTSYFRRVVNSGTSCSGDTSAAKTVTLLQGPVGGSLSGSTSICGTTNNGSIQLSGHSGTIEKWQYSVDGGTTWIDIVNTSTTQNYTNLTQSTTYRAVLTNGTCPAANSSTAAIQVSALSNGGNIQGATSVCGNINTGVLTLNGYTGTIERWQYSFDGGTNWIDITSTSNNIAYNNIDKTTLYRAEVKNGACPAAFSSTAAITYNQQAVGGTVSSDTTLCGSTNNGTLKLKNSVGTVQKWQSSTNSGSSWNDISNTTTSHTYSNLSTTTQFRALLISGNCPQSYSTPATVTVLQPSTPFSLSIAASKTFICTGESINFTATQTNGGSGVMYQWQKNGSSVPGATNSILTLNTLQNGDVITCVATTSETCLINTTATSNSVTVQVHALPNVSLAFTKPTICSNAPTFALSGGSPAGGIYSGNGVSANFFSPSTAGVGNHTITYTYTDGNGCSASATNSITVSACTAVSNLENSSSIKLFPNPFEEEAKLEIDLSNITLESLTIVSQSGQLVANIPVAVNKTGGSYSILLNREELHLKNGLYYLQIKTNAYQKTLKVLVL